MPGMTMEVLGTLVGAAIQGQIVASAHTLKHCPTHNVTTSYLGNSSGAEIVKSPVHSQDYLSHAVSVTVPSQEPRCAQSRPQSLFENNLGCQVFLLNLGSVECAQGGLLLLNIWGQKKQCRMKRRIVQNWVHIYRLSTGPDIQNGSCLNRWDWKEMPLFDIWTQYPEPAPLSWPQRGVPPSNQAPNCGPTALRGPQSASH